MAQISCKELLIGYDGHPLCDKLDFEINAGDYVCILGANGSGKSTLLSTLLSLRTPIGGSICFDDGVAANQIGYLPQLGSHTHDFPALVREVVISGCSSQRGSIFMGRRQKLEAMQNMKDMGVFELADKSYSAISGGQQQRVLLARALCAAHKLLLLDEPVSGLDPDAAADMYSLINHLNRHMGVTVVMVTHDIENAVKDANKVLLMGSSPRFFDSIDEYREFCAGGESK